MSVVAAKYEVSPFDGGRSFGATGAYEYLSGTVEIALDPGHPRNRAITDLDHAPTGADGRVQLRADFALLRPADPTRGNRRLLLDVPNRGNKLALRMFDRQPGTALPVAGEPVAGDGWLLVEGWTLAWCGWQHDVPESCALMGIDIPEIPADDEAATGTVVCRFQIDVATDTLEISDRGHRPYPAIEGDQADASLVVREHPDAAPTLIARADWRFADDTHITYPTGFEPGRFYELRYQARGARPTGAGLAALSDVASFLRRSTAPDNPTAGRIDHVFGYGASQSGGVLRTLLYTGLDVDEDGRPAFDAILADIAGSFRSEVNWRFGQPSYFGARSASFAFPFADAVTADPRTGEPDGILRRILERGGPVPKIIYSYTSSEYWALNASLTHTAADGQSDLASPENVRIYHFAGSQHGGGRFPPVAAVPELGMFTQLPMNIIDTHPLLRAALSNLDAWVTGGVEPPASRHPTLAAATLVAPATLAARFDQLPNLTLPINLPALNLLDFGPRPGLMSTAPPDLGPPLAVLVSAVDADGNEIGGIRAPEVAVPLATHTAWNRRPAVIGGAGQLSGLSGATVGFARTAEERQTADDPRASIAERYRSEADYLEQVRQAADALVAERYLLAGDVAPAIESAQRAYRWFTAD